MIDLTGVGSSNSLKEGELVSVPSPMGPLQGAIVVGTATKFFSMGGIVVDEERA